MSAGALVLNSQLMCNRGTVDGLPGHNFNEGTEK